MASRQKDNALSSRDYRLGALLPRRGSKIERLFRCRLGGDLDESKSTSGYVFTLGGGAVSWCSKKQDCIALSTMEAEYVACCLAAQEVIWLRNFLQDLNLTPRVDDPVEI